MTVNFAVLLAAILVALACSELAIRLVTNDTGGDTYKPYLQHDPLLGWKKIPNYQGIYSAEEFRTSLRINSRGVRGPEIPYGRDDKIFRILILGDSFSDGYTVSFENLFSEIFRHRLANHVGKPVEIINLGTSGYSTDQELLLFEQQGRKYNPDLTVLMFYENDVWFNAQDEYYLRYKPVFRIGEKGLKLHNVPVPLPRSEQDSDREGAAGSADVSHRQSLAQTLHQESALYRFVMSRIESVYWPRGLLADLGIEAPMPEPFAGKRVPDPFRVWKNEFDSETAAAWDVTESLLAALHDRVRNSGSEFLVFNVPAKVSVYPQVWEATRERYGLEDSDWSSDRTVRKLMRVCSELVIDCIDPTAAFRREAGRLSGDGEKLYYSMDPHWNARGNALAGEILANFVWQNEFESTVRAARALSVQGEDLASR